MEDFRTAAGGLAALVVEDWLAGAGAASLVKMWDYLHPTMTQVRDAAALVGQCGSLDTEWFETLFGRDWPGHAFAHRPHFFGFRADEPHYTKMLAAFMTPSHVGASVAWERARVFLGVLADVGAIDRDHVPGADQQVIVEAEKFFKAKPPKKDGRIDLVFSWGSADQTRVAAIEAKFGAGIHGDQLERYEAAHPDATLIFLASRREAELPKCWRRAIWCTLLPRWETALAAAEDNDEDFARYRRALWQVSLEGEKA